MHGDDDGARRFLPCALVGVGRAGIKVNGVTWFESAGLVAVMNIQFAIQHVEELKAGMHVGLGFHIFGERNKLGKVGVHVAVGDHVSQTLEVIGGSSDAGLGQTDTLFAAVNPENGVRLGFKEIR